MYQYSLAYVKKLFNKAIEKSEKSSNNEERLVILIDNITKELYTNVSRGLFEAHETIFSFLNITSINRNRLTINEKVWNVVLRGGSMSEPDSMKPQMRNPDEKKKYLSNNVWDLVYYVDRSIEEFEGIMDSMAKEFEKWTDWA